MDQPLEIKFDFALAPSDLIIPLTATAELHHSDPYYRITNIRVADIHHSVNHSPVLPDFEIKKIGKGIAATWVHCDSEKESLLSLAAGKAINETSNKPVV